MYTIEPLDENDNVTSPRRHNVVRCASKVPMPTLNIVLRGMQFHSDDLERADDLMEIAKILLARGAYISKKGDHCHRPTFLEACMCDNIEVDFLKELLARGANIFEVESHSGTNCNDHMIGDGALHFAIEELNLAVVKFLLHCGLDVNSRGKGGQTVLHRLFKPLRYRG